MPPSRFSIITYSTSFPPGERCIAHALLALLDALGGLFTPLGQVIDIEEDDDEDEEEE